MDTPRIRIIATGGGGCTNHADPELDDWIVGLLGRRTPRVGYLGTASGENPAKREGFEAAYGRSCVVAAALDPTASADACARWLDGLDLLYVGGGNTRVLLQTWRLSGWDRALTAAVRGGMAVAGVSAGAVCWFDTGFSDSDGWGYRAISGLGLVQGSCCPHYSEEPRRRPAFEDAVRRKDVPDGLAIDDGVAVLCDAHGAVTSFSARPGAAAYRVFPGGGHACREAVPLQPLV